MHVSVVSFDTPSNVVGGELGTMEGLVFPYPSAAIKLLAWLYRGVRARMTPA